MVSRIDHNGLGRRTAISLAGGALLTAGMAGAASPGATSGSGSGTGLTDADRAEWAAFRSRFIAPEGRVVDTGNGGISHSEGQGWGLLVAGRCDDRATFDSLLNWTVSTLKRRQDNLFSWRYRPTAARPVDDPNNATDGDLCIAWALLEAGSRWGNPDHAALGAAIGADVLRHLVRRVGGRTVLLPGARGFERSFHVVVNPSYYVFPAFQALARAVPDPAWVRAAADGLSLLRGARFGRWRLPPDWVAVGRNDGALTLPAEWPPRFSWDAVRVPLYLGWAGLTEEPGLTGPTSFWSDPRHAYLPAWADLGSNTISPYAGHAGIAAVAGVATALRNPGPVILPDLPPVAAATDYYSAALTMLARLARADGKFMTL